MLDDKSPLVIPFLLQRLRHHKTKFSAPFFVGLNGVQGAGKTTLVATLLDQLQSPPHNLNTIAFSIDDIYKTYSQLQALASTHSQNPLLQHRGQPGTHDVALGQQVFASLSARKADIAIPSYDKGAHSGKGDRADRNSWRTVNKPGEPTVDVVLFEGWCVGFRPLQESTLSTQLSEAADSLRRSDTSSSNDVRFRGRLGKQTLESIKTINDYLAAYDVLTEDAADTNFVYDWRLEQERALRALKHSGMSDDDVVNFVNGCAYDCGIQDWMPKTDWQHADYPSYELYLDVLRSGIFPSEPGKQLRLVVGKDRAVQYYEII